MQTDFAERRTQRFSSTEPAPVKGNAGGFADIFFFEKRLLSAFLGFSESRKFYCLSQEGGNGECLVV